MTLDARLGAGTWVAGRYVLHRPLGGGGFGEVWSALDERLGRRPVAIKFLHPDLARDPEGAARFETEAAVLALLRHPNVVAVLDRGVFEGRPFLVMEHIDGGSLGAWLDAHRARNQRPDLATVLEHFRAICEGVGAAHRVATPGPVVHRDLKPPNLLFARLSDGRATLRVVDFGIARSGARQHTRTGAMVGTLAYMAPEQATGRAGAIGPWTDVFALGVLLAEMLTLTPFAEADEPWWSVALQRPGAATGLLSQRRADVPPALWAVIARALSHDPAARPRDAAALRRAVDEALAAAPARSSRSVVAAAAVGAVLVPLGLATAALAWRATPSPETSPEPAPAARGATGAPTPRPQRAVAPPPSATAPPAARLALAMTSSCAVAPDATVRCWGGLHPVPGARRPWAVPGVAGARSVAVGSDSACALRGDGTVWCWGRNDLGQLGDGTLENRSVAAPVAGLSGVAELVAGSQYYCALARDRAVRCWGSAETRQFGVAPATTCAGGLPCARTPTAVPGFTGVVRVAVAFGFACALLADGAARCWFGGTTPIRVPFAPAADLRGGGVGPCLQARGGAWSCFDYASTPRRSEPVPLPLPAVPGAGAPVQGLAFRCVVGAGGVPHCWGNNRWGALGDGTLQDRATPGPVVGLTGVTELAAGVHHACARTAAGDVSCWGMNANGGVGDVAELAVMTPVRVAW